MRSKHNYKNKLWLRCDCCGYRRPAREYDFSRTGRVCNECGQGIDKLVKTIMEFANQKEIKMSEKQENYQCIGCGETKPKTAFYKTQTELGHEKRCKDCRRHRQKLRDAGYKPKTPAPPAAAPSEQSNGVIRVDLSRYPVLLKKLHEAASREFRTVDQQAAYMLHGVLG